MPEKRYLYKYISYIKAGYNLHNKLRLAIIVAFTNYIVLGKVPGSIGKILIGVSNLLSQGVTVTMNRLLYNLVDYTSLYICSPHFEDWAWDYLPVKEGDLFIDIGAHLGKYSLPIARAVGDKGSVIALEANSKNHDCLKNNVGLNNLHYITVLNIAAWSNDENLEFYPGESSGTGSINNKTGGKHCEISGRSLDSLLEEMAVGAPVDWIKIDVEGAELEVLKGAKKILCIDDPKLLVEVTEDNEVEFEHYMHKQNYHYCIIPESIRVGLKYYYCWKNEDLQAL